MRRGMSPAVCRQGWAGSVVTSQSVGAGLLSVRGRSAYFVHRAPSRVTRKSCAVIMGCWLDGLSTGREGKRRSKRQSVGHSKQATTVQLFATRHRGSWDAVVSFGDMTSVVVRTDARVRLHRPNRSQGVRLAPFGFVRLAAHAANTSSINYPVITSTAVGPGIHAH